MAHIAALLYVTAFLAYFDHGDVTLFGYLCHRLQRIEVCVGKTLVLVGKNDVHVFLDEFFKEIVVLVYNVVGCQIKGDHAAGLFGETDGFFNQSIVLHHIPFDVENVVPEERFFLDVVGTPLSQYAEIFNGIQTSAERPEPIYWFDEDEIVSETAKEISIHKFGHDFKIEKAILRPYFKPTDGDEKGSNSYTYIETKKRILFP